MTPENEQDSEVTFETRRKPGRKSVVDQQSVDAACVALAMEGQSIDYPNVKKKLGSGSKSKVYPHIRAWKELNEQPPSALLISAELAKAINEYTKKAVDEGVKFWRDKVIEADKVYEDLLVEVSTLEEEVEAKSCECAALSNDLNSSSFRTQMQVEKLAESQELTNRLSNEVREALARAERAEAVQANTTEHFNGLLEKQSKIIEVLNEQVIQARQDRDSCDGKREQLELALTQERHTRDLDQKNLAQVTSAAGAANREVELAVQRLMFCEHELKTSQEAFERLQKDWANEGQEILELRQRLDEAMIVRGRLEEQLRALKKRYVIPTEEVVTLIRLLISFTPFDA